MKLRFYPKTEAVRNVLVDRVKMAESQYEEDLAAANFAKDASIQIPGRTEDLVRMAGASLALLKDLRNELSLLESHGPPEVMCEIEL